MVKPLVVFLFLLNQCTSKPNREADFTGKTFIESMPDVSSVVGNRSLDAAVAQVKTEYVFGVDTTGEIRIRYGSERKAVVPFSWHIVGDSIRLRINKQPTGNMLIVRDPNGFTLKNAKGSITLRNLN